QPRLPRADGAGTGDLLRASAPWDRKPLRARARREPLGAQAAELGRVAAGNPRLDGPLHRALNSAAPTGVLPLAQQRETTTTAAVCALPLLAAPLAAEARPFTYNDMLVMDRVSDPQVSPDGRWVTYGVRATDMEANRGRTSLWIADLSGDADPRRLAVSDDGA